MLHVVADSSCDLFDGDLSSDCFELSTVPFSMRIGDVEHVDDSSLDTRAFLEAMESCREAGSSSCPSPHVWLDQFARFKEVVAVTISKNLSGSFASAEIARDLALAEDASKRVELLDCCATGPAALLAIQNMAQWANEGMSFDEVLQKAKAAVAETKTVFALSSFGNLVKNGRVSKLAGMLAQTLNLWGVGIESSGTIAMKTKVKGKMRMLKTIVTDMEERGFKGLEVAITHCQNAEMAEALRAMIVEKFPNAQVFVGKTRGLDSFYAERGGLIVSYR